MKDDSLQHTIDLLKRCGEEKGMTITEEEMAGKMGMPLAQLQAYVNGEQPTPDHLRAGLRAAYRDLVTAIKQDGYRDSLQSTIRAIKAFGRETGITITDEEMAGKISLSLAQLLAYVNGEQPAPAEMAGRLMTSYDELYKEIQQRNRNVRLRSTIEAIRHQGAKQGKEITQEEMARQLGMTGEELTVCLQDPGKTQEEFSALADKLRANCSGMCGRSRIRPNIT